MILTEQPQYLDTRNCTACGLVDGLFIQKYWPNKAKGGAMVEWKCRGEKCHVRIYEHYDGAAEAPSGTMLVAGVGQFLPANTRVISGEGSQRCPLCDDPAPAVHEFSKGDGSIGFRCTRCAAEHRTKVWARFDVLADPKNAPSQAGSGTANAIVKRGCQLCNKEGGVLVFFEGLWCCKSCRSVCEEGEYAISKVKK